MWYSVGMATASFSYPDKAFNAQGRHIGPGPWLTVIHAVNRQAPDTFGDPITVGRQGDGPYIEEYTTARVIMNGNDTVTIEALDAATGELLTAANTEVMG